MESEIDKNYSLLVTGCINGELAIVKCLIEQVQCNPKHIDKSGRTLLHHACQKNDNLALVKYLIDEHGADFNGKDNDGDTPLHVAALNGSLEILRYLIEEKLCNRQCKGKSGRTPLHTACEKNSNLAVVQYLIDEYQEDVSVPDNDGDTPLHVAVSIGNLDILRYFIEQRQCDSDCKGKVGRTLLHAACQKKENPLIIVKYLIDEHQADPSRKDGQGNTPLHVAARNGSLDILKYLIEERQCNPQCKGHLGRTPLHGACQMNDNLAMVKYLVEEWGGNPSEKDDQKNTPLHIAALCGSLNILLYLIEQRQCNPHLKGASGRTPLHHACQHDNLAMVTYLINKHGADFNAKDDQENTPLHLAAGTGSLNVMKYLIEQRQCNPQCKGRTGRTPLHTACVKNDNLPTVKFLIDEYRVNHNIKDDLECTPLHAAASSGSLDILKYLIEQRNCDPQCKGHVGRTPLHYACQHYGNTAMVKYLVEEKGCDVNCIDDFGITPFDFATTHANEPVVSLLKQITKIDNYETRYMAPQQNLKRYQLGSKNQYIFVDKYGEPVKLNHPDVKEDLGPQLPDWEVFQKKRGDVVFVNTKTKLTCDEDPRGIAERYDRALKEGYVDARLTKVLIVGSAGVGKTHLLHLLFNEPLPEVRSSTGLMERPVQAIMSSSKKPDKFERVSDKELYELLAMTVNDTNASPTTTDDSMILTSHSTSSSPQVVRNKENCLPGLSSKKSASVSVDYKYPHLQFNSSSFHVSEVAEQLIPVIAKSKNAEALLDIDWMYFIDSGGQPHFHHMLSAFMDNTNINVFVLRLCDKLNACPTVNYYNKGSFLSSSTSSLSNTEILQRCAQATQTTDKDGESRLLIVGTHRDREDECDGEMRDDKDRHMLELLKPSMKKYLLHSDIDGEKLIFPLNAKTPEDQDRQVIKEITRCIMNAKPKSKEKIPIRWLVFHQELQAQSEPNLLSHDECSQIAARLHMSQDINAALQFFTDLNVMLHYHKILPKVVFTNPQALLNVVSDIVRQVVYSRVEGFRGTDNLLVRAREEGIVSLKLLDMIKADSHELYHKNLFKADLFEAKDLLCILLHLNVISKLKNESGEYFMPSILKGLSEEGIQKELSSSRDTIPPITVHYKDRWLRCGEFLSLITSLLSKDEWELANEGHKFLCVYSNCIKMVYHTCLVTFVDAVSYIEIHLNTDDLDTCKLVCPDIKECISGIMNSVPMWDYICPCGKYKQRHLTTKDAKTQKYSCSKNARRIIKPCDLGAHFDTWQLSTSCTMTVTAPSRVIDDTDIAKIAGWLEHWPLVAHHLGLSPADISEIEQLYFKDSSRVVRMLMKWKVKDGKGATYEKLESVLRKLDQNGAADRVLELQQEHDG